MLISRYSFPRLRSLAGVLLAAWILCQAGLVLAQSAGAVTLDGKPFDPLNAGHGKVVVLVFLRTDCPISNRYAPTLQSLSKEFAGKAAFFLVYPDKSESAATIKQHLEEYSYDAQALRDPNHALVKRGQATITPEVAVFDGSGGLAYHGRIDNWYVAFGQARPQPTTHELHDAVEALLSGGRPAVASADAVGCYISDLQ